MMDAKRVLGWTAVSVALLSAVWIMATGTGLVDSLDFGAGAYYYTDIPGFERFTDGPGIVSDVPHWVIYAAFASWGICIYRLWVWADRRWPETDDGTDDNEEE